MGILFMDGFDSYSSSVTIDKRWSAGATMTYGTAGRFSGSCIAGFTASSTISHGLGGARSTLSAGFAVKFSGSATAFLQFMASGTAICALHSDSSGNLIFTRGSSPSVNVLGTGSVPLTFNAWHHVGIEFTRHASAGAVNVYLDGVQILSVSAANTGASDITDVLLKLNSSSFMVDDYYCVSGATWLGERRITTIRPSADTGQKDFTPNSGTANFSRVNEASMDGDTSYVSAATVNNEDIYDLDNLAYNPTTIDAVQVVLCGRKDDAATRTIAPVVVSGVTTDVGADVAMAASYGMGAELYETDPDTTAAWTVSAVNALQAGMKVTA